MKLPPVFFFLSLASVCIATAAEPVEIPFKAAVDGSPQLCVELLPPEFDPAQPHDVLIALHGHGSDRWQFIRDGRDECRAFRDMAAKHGLILVSPDYRAKTSWMGPAAEADLLQIIADTRKRHKTTRFLVGGGSMGGTSALIFAALHPEAVSGVCALNGTANMLEYARFQDAIAVSYGASKEATPAEYRKRSPELWPRRFLMPVSTTTGGKDQVVPPDSVLRLTSVLSSLGVPVLALHREAVGHSTPYKEAGEALEFTIVESRREGVEARLLRGALDRLQSRADAARANAQSREDQDALAEAMVFAKGVEWALRYETNLSLPDVAQLKRSVCRATERLDFLEQRSNPWSSKRGRVVRAFTSRVDGSIQPYGAVVPSGYDGTRPMRLDVVLHGSSKPVGMSETRFIARFDEGDTAGTAPEADFIEIHPLGRVENCYRWAGETDVFEAIDAAARAYNIDRDRIVLRGMSMGASGTWHLGLKHPSRFVALGPYCGYVDTHRFSHTPIPGFVRVDALPLHQEMALHMLDSVDYAANASMVPVVAAIGDKDVFFQSHVHMGEAFKAEGLEMVNLLSQGTGHVQDPPTHREQLRLIAGHAQKGLDHDPESIRFVTWTLKYSRCHWLELLGLERHYEKAEVRARRDASDHIEVQQVSNITRFAVHRPVSSIRIEGRNIALPEPRLPAPASQNGSVSKSGSVPPAHGLLLTKTAEGWQCSGAADAATLAGKRPGLQGPIDDAFASPFLCVRGTGTPWNGPVHAWAMASLERFQYAWARYMRGDLPVKDDVAVTPEDLRDKHLVVFGDPGSNSLLAQALPRLPLRWSQGTFELGGETFSSAEHAPVLIAPNPLSVNRYMVVNSGHSFHEKEFAAFNYLLFPRLGDCAVVKPSPGSSAEQKPTDTPNGEVLRAGYFTEDWQQARWIRSPK
jgi:pimeloyl-ACP methyl ester carboxylesterase